MAATPPLQITSTPLTPPTPLHGAAYDQPSRQSARIKQRVISHSHSTPEPASRGKRITSSTSSTYLSPSSKSTQSTPRNPPRRVQVISPSSPNTEISPPKPTKHTNAHLQPLLSSTTTMMEGIPTPVKTPRKKDVPNVNVAARALFQDANAGPRFIAPSPRKGRKNKRYNGFSLESFHAEEENGGRVQIFTDTRDKVPEVDKSEANPFIDPTANGEGTRTKRLAGGSKRRKVSAEKRVDPQVQAAINDDEGMVYVFRGKKVYRRFDDAGEEEEDIDANDLGLLEHSADGAKRLRPLKTLTRKTIKPTRLFQSEAQKRRREREKEEEALTDVEEQTTNDAAPSEPGAPPAIPDTSVSSKLEEIDKPKRASPFDAWPRVKSSSRPSSTSRGQKRTSSEAFCETASGGSVETLKVRRTRG